MDPSLIVPAICFFAALLGVGFTTLMTVHRLEKKLNALLLHHGIDPSQSPPLSERVKELAVDPSRKIEAIKLYREETAADLAEAKKAVESFIQGSKESKS